MRESDRGSLRKRHEIFTGRLTKLSTEKLEQFQVYFKKILKLPETDSEETRPELLRPDDGGKGSRKAGIWIG